MCFMISSICFPPMKAICGYDARCHTDRVLGANPKGDVVTVQIPLRPAQHGAVRNIRMQGEKLVFLEVGRAIAALIVVLHHADQATAYFSDIPRDRLFMWGQYGVDFFFVLSGFIIFYTHRHDSGGLSQARLYAFKRVSRIYVPYLPVALAYMGLLLMFQQGPVADRPWSLWATLTLLPAEKSATLTVAWTLTYELIFYAFFLLAFVSRRVLLVASLIWCAYLLAVLTTGMTPPAQPVLAALSNPIVLEFFCGALAAHLFVRVPAQMRGGIWVAGLALLALVLVFWTGDRALLGPPLALIVLALAMTPYRTPRRMTDAMIFLGAASYAVYLVHSPVISILARVLQPLDTRIVVFCACVGIGTALGVAYHLLFERPVLRWVHRFRPVVGMAGWGKSA